MKTKLSLLIITIMFGLITPCPTFAVQSMDNVSDTTTVRPSDDEYIIDPLLTYEMAENLLATFGISDRKINHSLKKIDRYYRKKILVLRKYAQKSRKGVDAALVKAFLDDMKIYIGGVKFDTYQPSDKLVEAFTPTSLNDLAMMLEKGRNEIKKAKKISNFKEKMKRILDVEKEMGESGKRPSEKLLKALGKELFGHLSLQPIAISPYTPSLEIEKLSIDSVMQQKEKERIARDQQIFENAYTMSPQQVSLSKLPYHANNDIQITNIEATDDYTKITFAIPIHFPSNWFSTSYEYIEDLATGDKYYARYNEKDIPMGRIIIIKDNARTMTEVTTVYPPLGKGVQFVKIEDDPQKKIELPSNSSPDTGGYGIINLAKYIPQRYEQSSREIR